MKPSNVLHIVGLVPCSSYKAPREASKQLSLARKGDCVCKLKGERGLGVDHFIEWIKARVGKWLRGLRATQTVNGSKSPCQSTVSQETDGSCRRHPIVTLWYGMTPLLSMRLFQRSIRFKVSDGSGSRVLFWSVRLGDWLHLLVDIAMENLSKDGHVSNRMGSSPRQHPYPWITYGEERE